MGVTKMPDDELEKFLLKWNAMSNAVDSQMNSALERADMAMQRGTTEPVLNEVRHALRAAKQALEASQRENERYRYLRPELRQFARLMENELRKNDDLKGGWRREPIHRLIDRAYEELDELKHVTWREYGPQELGSEAADVANFMMMVADNGAALKEADDE